MLVGTSIFVGDLRTHVGTKRDVHIEIDGETFNSGDVQITGEISGDLICESISHGVVVHGQLRAQYSATCSYGLVDIVEPIQVSVNEIFEEQRHGYGLSGDEECYQYSGDYIDIEQMLRDVIIPALPLAPVCSHGPENCAICSNQIVPFISKEQNLLTQEVIGDIDNALDDVVKDPRWSGLDDWEK